MTINRDEIDQMAKFMMATNNLIPSSDSNASLPKTNRVARASPIASGDVFEMKNILERFYRAENNLLVESIHDRVLNEAFHTEEIPNGARIGNWSIIANQIGKHKIYDVVHVITGEKIAEQLLLHEAALGLVRYLNDGVRLNSQKVIELLNAEQTYANAIHDMRLFKHRMKTSPNSPKTPIYEDRYHQAKRKAIHARTQVEKNIQRF